MTKDNSSKKSLSVNVILREFLNESQKELKADLKDLLTQLKAFFTVKDGQEMISTKDCSCKVKVTSGESCAEACDETLDVLVFVDASRAEMETAFKQHPKSKGQLGYAVYVSEFEDKSEKRILTNYVLEKIATHSGYFSRVVGPDFDNKIKTEIENDLLNSAYLLSSQGESKTNLIKRFLDVCHSFDKLNLWFAERGILKRPKESNLTTYDCFNTSLSRAQFSPPMVERLHKLNAIQNKLWMKMSYSYDKVLKLCENLEKEDEFVAQFVRILRLKKDSKTATTKKLLISRNDFIREGEDGIFQVEYNMIASSLGPISERHDAVMTRMEYDFRDVKLPKQEVIYNEEKNEDFLVEGLKAGHEAYGNPDAMIVMVCGEEKNVLDQWAPAQKLSALGISLERYSFKDLDKLLEFDEATGKVTLFGREVSLFYLREGYTPDQYTPETWKLREKIELSQSLITPDIALQLVNFKFFQYILNKKESWLDFGLTESDFTACSSLFKDIKILKDFNNSKSALLAYIASKGGPSHFVLKPQREGGANNCYNEEILSTVEKSGEAELKAYILMEKIEAREYRGIHTDWGRVYVRDIVDEIGLFYYNLWDSGESVKSVAGETLVRSKISGINEGGLSTGFAVINSIKTPKFFK